VSELLANNEIRFTVPAVPVAQPRPRAVAFNGKARVFGAPSKHPVHAFKATCRMAAEKAHPWGVPLFDCPLRLELLFVMPRPKMPKNRGTDRLPHSKRPDFDNLEKAAVDALTGFIWKDDSLLCDVRTKKVIAAVGESPHVEIVIRPL
jgi:Holliday junction resolvase RusA-like endonuclease